MNKRTRATLALLVLALTLSFFCITSYAEASDPTPPVQDLPTEEAVVGVPPHIADMITAMEANGTTYVVKFTGDSVYASDVYLEPGYDELVDKLYFDIVVELPEGYDVYNDAATEYVDGVKINDEFLATARLPHRIYITDPTLNYTVFVKTVYKDNLFGTLAKIYDGNATVLDLFDNPVMLAQTLYYSLAILSVVVSIILAIKYKKYKAKSSTDIATETVAAVDHANVENSAELKRMITDALVTKIVPMVETCLKSNQDVVKAIAISNSKSKDAPLAILDLLGSNSKLNIDDIIGTLKEATSANIAAEDAAKEHTLQLLQNIVDSIEPTVDDTPAPTAEDTPSVF